MQPKNLKKIAEEIQEKRIEALRLESEADGAAEVLAILRKNKTTEEVVEEEDDELDDDEVDGDDEEDEEETEADEAKE